MKIGLVAPAGNSPRRDFGFLKALSQAIEDVGFASIWAPEHVVFFPSDSYDSQYPYSDDGAPPWGSEMGIYDPLFVCAMVAEWTTTLRMSTSVLILPQRPALLTAKEVMTLDHIAQGRFEFGVGGGWSSEEYEALGVSFEKRGKRFDEYIEAIRAAWTQDRAAYHGEFVSFENVVLLPKPVTPGGPPFLIGGDSKAAMRRAARLGDGWYGWWVKYELEPHLAQLRAILKEHGRENDPNFHLKVGIPYEGDPDGLAAKIEEARRNGVGEFTLALPIGAKSLDADVRLWAQAAGLSG